jgi:putative ABC transport system permease protein
VTGPFTSFTALPEDLVDAVVSQPGVVSAAPLVTARYVLQRGETATDGIVVGYRTADLGAPKVVAGEAADAPGELVLPEESGAELGEQVVLGPTRFIVTGLTRETTLFAGLPVIYMPLDAAQALVFDGRALASTILVRGEVSAPDGYAVLDDDAVARDALRPLEQAISSIDLMTTLLWAVAAMIIAAVVYLSALERQRDIAVLKAVGASGRVVVATVALQAMLVAIVAAAGATGLQRVLAPLVPMPVYVTTGALGRLPMVAVGVALLASLAGLRRIQRIDPALAFAGPGG